MKKSDLAGIFLRSLSIQSSWNFRGMQDIGFAYSLIPLARSGKGTELLERHIRPFSSHPYLTGAIIASVARLEEESAGLDAVRRKEALMAPYAAVGDPFFWGGLRPFSSSAAVILAIQGLIIAPLFFLLLYNSVHIWIRLRGFIEGYRDRKGGVGFLGRMALPYKTSRLKWCTTFFLALLGAIFVNSTIPPGELPWGFALGGTLLLVIFCSWVLRRGISSLALLYGTALFFVAVA
ncbi:MAG: PTS system mannose/fructose/sorbose family transporter subunit IID [Deltaproteobacteria bacterium]|nr:PTS system mannose/fructose/sorbose family transporter subunit IID [Deltaproteobacteria bacterium]